jgi:mono/diheme cytochrome c family protein
MSRRIAIALAAIALVVVVSYREALRHGFSAREKPWAVEAFVARNLRRLATGSDVKSKTNPLKPSPAALAEARDHFADHCATCHANDGSGKTAINDGLYPPAPDLREHGTQRLTDGELLNIIQNGIRFTGMPGWGGEDDENWKLVLFIRHLPNLSRDEIELMEELQATEKPGDRHRH